MRHKSPRVEHLQTNDAALVVHVDVHHPRLVTTVDRDRPSNTSRLDLGNDDRWVLSLRGAEVTSVAIEEFRIVIGFSDGSDLTIEGAATLGAAGTDPAGAIDVWSGAGATQLAAARGTRVLSAVIFKSGGIRFVLSDGSVLRVPVDPNFESWQLSGRQGVEFVAVPGGGVTHFPPV